MEHYRRKKEKILYLSNDVIQSREISDCTFAVYSALKASLPCSTTGNAVCISLHQISYFLTGKLDITRKNEQNLKSAVNELENFGIIRIIDELHKNYVIDCSNMIDNSSRNYFTIINCEEIRRIFTIENINNFQLFRYFVCMISTISNSITVTFCGNSKNRVVGNLPVNYIAEMCGISKRSAVEYNKILESEKLIYIFRQNDFSINGENEIRKLKNVYGRFQDKEYIDEFALNCRKYNNSYNYANKDHENSCNNRRLAQMYVAVSKNENKNYSNEDMREIYEYVVYENEKYKSLHEKTKNKSYLEKIRDVSIFKDYDFFKTE